MLPILITLRESGISFLGDWRSNLGFLNGFMQNTFESILEQNVEEFFFDCFAITLEDLPIFF